LEEAERMFLRAQSLAPRDPVVYRDFGEYRNLFESLQLEWEFPVFKLILSEDREISERFIQTRGSCEGAPSRDGNVPGRVRPRVGGGQGLAPLRPNATGGAPLQESCSDPATG
jgi:hypothetical protein